MPTPPQPPPARPTAPESPAPQASANPNPAPQAVDQQAVDQQAVDQPEQDQPEKDQPEKDPRTTPTGKVLVFTAPSGAGKTTLVRHLLEAMPAGLAFSVSATTRAPRAHEQNGRDYHFLSQEEFERRVAAGEFLEYEEVYEGMYYGTLASEVARLWAEGKCVLFDIEVKGATNIKRQFGDAAYVVFVAPPDEETLYARLRGRGTEDESSIRRRIARATEELSYRDRFDEVLVNDDLVLAKAAAERLCREWVAA